MKLEKIVAQVLAVDETELSDESNALNTRNWDSLRHIELLLAVETAYEVRFSMAEITSMQKLGDMRDLLSSKGAAT
ncbi:MAG: acyl carrier protein [Pseudomonadota bacterium]